MTEYDASLTELLDREPVLPGGSRSCDVDYRVGDTDCCGYLARPDDAETRPGVLVVHDWFGVNDYARMRCDQLARLGYVAFAADIFGRGVHPGPAEAAAVAGRYYADLELWRARISGALQRLRAEPGVDPDRIGALGFCFGGATVLQLARTGAALSAVISFHGGMQTGPEGEVRDIRAPLLVLHGDADPIVPAAAVATFLEELRTAPALDWQLVLFSGAMHSFTQPYANSPEHGAQYDPRSERRSWSLAKDMLRETLAGGDGRGTPATDGRARSIETDS